MTKRPFNTKGIKAKECLELVHTNVCGPFNVQACGGYEYFIIFTDDYSRYGYVYPLHRKSDALNKFKEFNTKLKNYLGKCLKELWSDQGGEYILVEFDS